MRCMLLNSLLGLLWVIQFPGQCLALDRKLRESKYVQGPVPVPIFTGYEENEHGFYEDAGHSVSRKRRDFGIGKNKVDSDEEANEELGADWNAKKKAKREEKDIHTYSSSEGVKQPEGYSIYKIPKDEDGNPIHLYVNMGIRNILDLDEMEEMIKMDILFSVMWTDCAILHFNNESETVKAGVPKIDELTEEEVRSERVTLNNPNILHSIWKPNLFIENLLSVKQPALMAKPVTIKFISKIGWFEYHTRLTIKMDCEMGFHHYPADSQHCDFSVRGFSYGQNDLALHWFQNGVYLDDITLPSFDIRIQWIDKLSWLSRKGSTDSNDAFDVLRFRISARRKLSYHLVQTYMASTFYIIITTLCFLLPSRMIEARIGISMTTLLTLTAMFAAVRESTPIVSYVKAIDTWMVGCIFFVFLTLSQFTFHTWLKGEQEEEEQAKEKCMAEKNSTAEELEALNKPSFEMRELGSSSGIDGQLPKTAVVQRNGHSNMERMVKITEKYSFLFFLSLFALYTFIYWTWLLTSADYFNWSVDEKWNNVHEDSENYR